MFSRGNKLWLCLCFPLLPLEALAKGTREEAHPDSGPVSGDISEGCRVERGLDEQPVAVLEKQRVLVANSAAAALGVKPGQAAAAARTLAEGIRLLERDPAAERR